MTRPFSVLMSILACGAAPCVAAAQAMVQPLGFSDSDRLAAAMRRLAVNATDVSALIDAGELSLKLDDLSGAAALFARADRIDPHNGRVKAGMASIMVRAERPGEALHSFQLAEADGLAPAAFAADRGLAYDLVGEQERAQRDYRLALKLRSDDETVRRYALSLGISGQRDRALEQLAPLLQRTDRGAWRARAFVLAMTGDTAEAMRIATTMMPTGMAGGVQQFLQRLASLSAVDRAFAVHFGEVRATPERLADARLMPDLTPLGPDPDGARVKVAAANPVAADARHTDRRSRDQDRRAEQLAQRAPVGTAARSVGQRSAPTASDQAAPATAPAFTTAGAAAVRTLPASVPGVAAVQPPAARVVATNPAQPIAPLPTGPVLVPQPALAAAAVNQSDVVLASNQPFAARPAPAFAARAANSAPAAPASTTTILPTAVPVPASNQPVATPDALAPTTLAANPASISPNSPAPIEVAPAAMPAVVTFAPNPGFSPAAAPLPTALAQEQLLPAAPEVTASTAPAIARVALPPSEASLGTVSAEPPRAAGVSDDVVLARIVANLGIPATELGVNAPPRAAEPSAPDVAVAEANAVNRKETADKKAAAGKLASTHDSAERETDAKSQRSTKRAGADGPPPVTDKLAVADKKQKRAGADKRSAKKAAADEDDDALAPGKKALADAKGSGKKSGKKDSEEKATLADFKTDKAGKKMLADKAGEEKGKHADPQRIWVQVAGGASADDLPKAWAAAKAKAPTAFAGRVGYSTPLRATNRVLAGPFKTDAEARSFVNQLARKGVSAFSFTSDKGQSVSKLPSE